MEEINTKSPPLDKEQNKIQQNTESVVKKIRTYEGDVADVLSHNNVSTTTIAIAENDKKRDEGQVTSEKKPHFYINIFIALSSLILMAAGIFVAYYLYNISPLHEALSTNSPVSQDQTYSSLVLADSQVVIPVDNLEVNTIIAKIKAEEVKAMQPNSIKEVIFTRNSNGVSSSVTASEMMKIMNINVPDILARSITDKWMFGIYSDEYNQRSVFVIATNNFFQNAFSGMLQWEHVMADDLKQYLYSSSVMGIANVGSLSATSSTSTDIKEATTSDFTQSYLTIDGTFEDRIIKNKDIRAFVTENGTVLFLYSFIDNQKLVVAANGTVLSEILNRLEKQAFVR